MIVERTKEVILEEDEEDDLKQQHKSVDEATAGNRTLGSRSANSEGQQWTNSRLAVSILRPESLV